MDLIKRAMVENDPGMFIHLLQFSEAKKGQTTGNGKIKYTYYQYPINDGRYLVWAASKGHIEVLEYLKSIGADLQYDDNIALLTAVREGNIEVMDYLIENGVSVNDSSLIMNAIDGDERRLEILKYLIDHGLKPDQAELDYALNYALEIQDEELVNYLRYLKENTKENIEEKYNSTSDKEKENDDIVMFILGDTKKVDCYLKDELRQLRSSNSVGGEPVYKLPWSGAIISQSVKEYAQNLQGIGPIRIKDN